MKKLIVLILALVMVLTLTACDSQDYKKAMGLYEEGDYVSARAIFVELADYENSAEMVRNCDYGIAVENMENGNFQEAFEQFKALGDFQDSVENARKCAWNIVYNHMGEGNNTIKSLGNSQYAIIMAKDGQLYVGWSMQMSGLINCKTTIAIIVDMEGNVKLAGSDELSTHAARYKAAAQTEWNYAAYKNGDTMTWDEFEVSGYNAYNKPYDRESTMLHIFLTSAVKNATAYLESYLTENGLGITMKDLGFTSYN